MITHPQELHVVVLKGGPSAEREVSLQSGAAIAAALRRLGYIVSELEVPNLLPAGHSPDLQLADNVDIVFIALHGTFGEDGQLQQILEDKGLLYTGCDVESSRRCMDKIASKQLFLEADIPTPKYQVLSADRPRLRGDVAAASTTQARQVSLAFPLVVKPAAQGSSVGVQIVDQADQLEAAINNAFRFGDKVIIEEFIAGREITVGILGETALPIVEICPKKGFYDYPHKYTRGATEYICPASLDAETAGRTTAWAHRAFVALGCRDFGRIDIRLRKDGQPFILEINTLPGMTETSLFPKAAATAGMGFDGLCSKIIELAMERRTTTAPIKR